MTKAIVWALKWLGKATLEKVIAELSATSAKK